MENELEVKQLQDEFSGYVENLDELKRERKELLDTRFDLIQQFEMAKKDLNFAKDRVDTTNLDICVAKNCYLNDKSWNRKMTHVVGGMIIFTLVATPFIFNGRIDNMFMALGLFASSPLVGASFGILSYLPFVKKHLNKLENEFFNTDEYKELQNKLNEKIKDRERIEDAYNQLKDIIKEYKEKLELNEFNINDGKRNMKEIEDKLIILLLPDTDRKMPNFNLKYRINDGTIIAPISNGKKRVRKPIKEDKSQNIEEVLANKM